MAIFGRELLGSSVLDRTGALLGRLSDIHFDLTTGMMSELVVDVEAGVDPGALPFERRGHAVLIPASAIARIGQKIHLSM